MATKQRVRAVLDARRASRTCWRCTPNQTRYSSTSLMPHLRSETASGPDTPGETGDKHRVRVPANDIPVPLATRGAVGKTHIQVMNEGQPVKVNLVPRLRAKDQTENTDLFPNKVSVEELVRFIDHEVVSRRAVSQMVVPPKYPVRDRALFAGKQPESIRVVRTLCIRPQSRPTTLLQKKMLSNTKHDVLAPSVCRYNSQDAQEIEKVVKPFREIPAESSEGHDRPNIKKHCVRERPATKRLALKDQRGAKILDALESLLDELRTLHTPNWPNPTVKTGNLIRSVSPRYSRSSPPRRALRPPSTTKLIPNPQILDISKRLFSTMTPGAANRHYATAASQTLRADAVIDPPTSKANPNRLVEGRSENIREALRLWQEQHDVVLADTSGPPPSSTLRDTQNLFTQSREDDSSTRIVREDEMDENDDVEFEPVEQVPDIFAHQVFLRRGDLVELVVAQTPLLAIFVRNVADQCQFYTIRGEWVNREPMGARWAVSRFVDPSDLNQILPYLPAEEVAAEKMDYLHPIDVNAPRDAGAKVIKQMLLFHQAADAVFRKYAERISRLYDILAPPEGVTGPKRMSLKDIAMKVLMTDDPSELTQPMMWTIHRALAQNQNVLWDKMNYRQNPIYEIYPQQSLKYIHQVREWVREYQESITQETTNQSASSYDSTFVPPTLSLNPIATFVQKARFAIWRSRQTRPLSKTGLIGPSSTKIDIDENSGEPYREVKMHEFDHNEKIIIHYLDAWAISSYLNEYTNLASLGPMIVRAVGMYEGFELHKGRGFTLLQELGVVTPWENRVVYRLRGLRLPGHDGGIGEVTRMLLDAHTEYEHFEQKDAMEGLRKDWSDMPVFCIDSAETEERDDGVSLELIENDPSAYWVHVHVANPSAFITPNTSMAKYAALLTESVYFPEKKYPMLNPNLTRDRLSLANDRPCITFSAKISTDGDTLKKKVTPGIVRNVHYFTPETVSQGLSLTKAGEQSETVRIFAVGGRMPTQPVDDQTSEALTNPEHIKILQKLLELGEAARHKRIQAGAPDFNPSARIEAAYPVVYASRSADKYSMVENQNVRQFEGDPIITIQRTTEAYGLVAKMVSDLMIIAGDVGASWCSERNIPIPYRGILRNLEPASSPEAFKRNIIDAKVAKYGHTEQGDLRRYMRLVGQAQASDRPLQHLTLGLPAYCKITSPLRRYTDLYTHWQVEAAIRHEAATGTSLVGSTDDSYPPFSRADVEEYAAVALHRERTISLAKNSSTRHWMCQALFRALYFREATLPETFEVRCVDGWAGPRFCPAWSALLNVKVKLMHSDAVRKEGGCKMGDLWEARLKEVDPYLLTIEMGAVRLVEREVVG